jgi:hypothetical protein
MDTPIYEYMHYQDIVDISGVGNLKTPEKASVLVLGLGDAGNRLTEHLMNFEGGRYEVISHSLLKIGDMLVVSYLLRRIAGQQNMS